MTHCIGIDLGTTNSVISYYNPQTDQVEIIQNLNGDRITPSMVSFLPEMTLVGERDPESTTISHVKRFIGRKYTDAYDIITELDYEVQADSNDYPLIHINEDLKLKPEEISAKVLKYLKQSAEDFLGDTITEAVITIPAYFNEAQRRATRDACTLAGLECLRLVPEPTAACLCYGLQRSEEETVLVFDLGGGTLDTSILQLHGGIFEVLATSGNVELGGTDLDYMIAGYLQEKYKEEHEGELEISQETAEKIKKSLSNRKSFTFRSGKFKYNLSRAEFENIAAEFIEQCMLPVEQVLKDSGLVPEQISQIVLVGGSTRIPIIQETLSNWFNGKTLNKSINPDEAVAYGAAIQASIIKQVGSKATELLLLDVNPLSLGIEVNGGIMNTIIKRNSTLPCEASKVFSTIDDNQETVEIQVFQGERQFTKDNIKLGVFTLDGLPRAARGVAKIMVKFTMDCDGLLHVSAVDKNTGLANSISLNSESNLSSDEIDRMLKNAERNQIKDYNMKQGIEELNRFEKHIYQIQRQLNLDQNIELMGEDLSPVNQYIINTLDWIVAHKLEPDLETVQNCRSEVDFRIKPYLDLIYSHQMQLEKSGINLNPQNDNQTEDLSDLYKDLGLE